MKKLLALVLVACMLTALMSVASFANDDYNIPKALTAPTLDGVMSEGEWDGALCMELTADGTYDVCGVMDSSSADYGTGKFYFMWDENGMYVAAVVNDTNQNFLFSGSEGAYNAYDGVQLCIYPDVDASGSASGDLFFISAVQTADGGFAISDHFSFDGNPQDLEASDGASVSADDSYVIEFCVSAADLVAGNTQLVVADGVQFAMTNIIMSYGDDGQGLVLSSESGWFDGSSSDRYTFVTSATAGIDPNASAGDDTDTDVDVDPAPATADILSVVAVVGLISFGGYVVAKKH